MNSLLFREGSIRTDCGSGTLIESGRVKLQINVLVRKFGFVRRFAALVYNMYSNLGRTKPLSENIVSSASIEQFHAVNSGPARKNTSVMYCRYLE